MVGEQIAILIIIMCILKQYKVFEALLIINSSYSSYYKEG